MLQSSYRNELIRRLSPGDLERIRPHLEAAPVKAHQKLIEMNTPVTHIYFPESGQFSILAKVAGTEPIEVGMFGREGMSDMAPGVRVPLEVVCQVGGDTHRVGRETYSALMRESVALANLTSAWQHCLLIQTSFCALSHGAFTIVERLARYVLMVHDRLEGDDIPLVHVAFAWALGVRRAGVSEAIAMLIARGAIRAERAHLIVLDRAILIDIAAGSYGPPEREYVEIMGKVPVAGESRGING